MKYREIFTGEFVDRPNRFIAHVKVRGKTEVVHVKNTGRCREILTPGCKVLLAKGEGESRKTAYDLVAAYKGERLINIDSQAPNVVAAEWILSGQYFKDVKRIKPETVFGDSRFDFYLEDGERKIFLEVKGVTLERENVVSFPDAPSERAVKHIRELERAVEDGYEAYVLFVIQMKDVNYFLPEENCHPKFAECLREAREKGVHILAYDCFVGENELRIESPVPVFLGENEKREHLKYFQTRLLAWYEQNRRILPWRENPTPYHVWLSEIMLQQTRVEAVKPYYSRFLEKIPDIRHLARAEQDTLLKLWEGLGYYSRIRNMQEAAKTIGEQWQWEMPGDYKELLKLKGIGEYTAGAIASIAFGQPVAAVDGNVLRVLARYQMDKDMITEESTKKKVFGQLNEIITSDTPGAFNQAIMDLGAMVCLPNTSPHCEQCPLQFSCKAHLQGCESLYPRKKKKKERTIEKKTILVIADRGRIALHKRPEKGLLAGLYEFPNLEGHLSREEVIGELQRRKLVPLYIRKIEESVHIFTHKEWHMCAYFIRVDELTMEEEYEKQLNWEYVKKEDIQERYPIPSAFATYVPYIYKSNL